MGVRRRTLLERIDFYLSYRAGTEALVSQLARLLDLGAVGLPELRQMAVHGEKGGLAAQLASLSSGSARVLTGCHLTGCQGV